MRILLANKYFFIKGGAEASFFNLAKILELKGHTVIFFSMHHTDNFTSKYSNYFISNVDYKDNNFYNVIKASGRILYSFEAKWKIEKLLKYYKIDIAHLNNIYHQISPSIISSLKKFNIPIVMTLRDYKMVCASYLMINDGKICEACKSSKYFECFKKKCVKNSKLKSLLNFLEMSFHHKILHIYNLIDVFISPSRFLKNKLEEMGFKQKIVYLPNFVFLDECKPTFGWEENSIVYFGRLSKEKGLLTLLEAMKNLNTTLKIIGEGPVKAELESKIIKEKLSNIKLLGFLNGERLKNEISKSMFVIVPSEWYENNPRSVIEGFSLGKPVIGSNIGGIPELIENEKTGVIFEPGNANDLKEKIFNLINSPDEIIRLGKNARRRVESELGPEIHYEKLMNIYNSLM